IAWPKPLHVSSTVPTGRTLRLARLMRLAAGSAALSEVRPVLLRYAAARGWRDIPPKPLAQDLLRLGLARRTRTFEELRRDDPGRLCWDHAEVGTEAPIAAGDARFGVVALGDAPYGFPALNELLRRYSRTRRTDEGEQD
ncbi:MAG: hypothetical protein ABI927_01290, partial [Gaiellaceae bacterium]